MDPWICVSLILTAGALGTRKRGLATTGAWLVRAASRKRGEVEPCPRLQVARRPTGPRRVRKDSRCDMTIAVRQTTVS